MKYKALLSCALIAFSSFSYAGGFGIGATRVIFEEGSNQAKFIINNGTKDSDYLVQSWVDNKGPAGDRVEVEKAPFIITPPLVKISANSKNELRVVSTGSTLPRDRESVFWVNVKSIPRIHDTASGNSMNIAIKNRIKLFYRPTSISETYPNGNDGVSTLVFTYVDKKLVINNPSPFYVSLFELNVDGVKVDTGYDMVPPKGMMKYSLTNTGEFHKKVTWKGINDFGAITEEKSQNL